MLIVWMAFPSLPISHNSPASTPHSEWSPLCVPGKLCCGFLPTSHLPTDAAPRLPADPSCLRTTYEDYVGRSLDALSPTKGLVRLEAQKPTNTSSKSTAILVVKPEAPWPADYADGLLVCFQHVHGPCTTPEQLCAADPTDPDVGCRVALFTNGYKCWCVWVDR